MRVIAGEAGDRGRLKADVRVCDTQRADGAAS